MSYPGTDVFIICYSIIEPDSYNDIKTKWYKEVKDSIEDKSEPLIVLVGNKCDAREKTAAAGKPYVTVEQGMKLQREIKAKKFIECSALTQHNLALVFEDSVRVYKDKLLGQGKKKKNDKDCVVM